MEGSPVTQPSLSFDRAADFYDATRALPPDVSALLTDAILAELGSAGRLLEVGVGTGRISRPLMERGLHVVGVDIAPRMMKQLRAQLTSPHTPPDLLLADATWLPFREASFPALLFVHVLHLIPDWHDAVAEMRRVLAPGGVVLSHWDQTKGANWGEPSKASDWDAAGEWWKEALHERGFQRRKRANIQDIDAALACTGGETRLMTIARREEVSTVAEEMELTRNRIHSWNWEIPDDLYAELLPRHERWALDHFGGPDAKLRRAVEYKLQVWRFPG